MKSKKPNFLEQFLGDKDVAAVAPSSKRVIGRLMKALRLKDIRTIVELGPGPGIATLPILRKLSDDVRYIAFEKNPVFAAALSANGDRRLTVLEEDARKMKRVLNDLGVATADAVIASIPFSYLSKADRLAVVDAAYKMLSPGGDLIIFHQYTPLMAPIMKKRFGNVRTDFELLNVFPCFLMRSTKV